MVNNLLRKLNKEREKRESEEKRKQDKRSRFYHYALMKREHVQARGIEFFDELGVKPIGLDSFTEIPQILGHLYGQALIRDFGTRQIELPFHQGRRKSDKNKIVYLTPEQYFEELCACRLSMVRKKKSYVYPDNV